MINGLPVIATACVDDTAGIWDAATGRLIAMCREVSFGAYRSNVAWGVLEDGPVLAAGNGIWDSSSGRRVATLSGASKVSRVLWGKLGGRPVVAANGPQNSAGIWDPATGEQLVAFEGHSASVTDIVRGRLDDSTVVITGSDDHTIAVWNPETGKRLSQLSGHSAPLTYVAWAALGTRSTLATASDDRTAGIWDLATGVRLVSMPASNRSLAWADVAGRPVLATPLPDDTVAISEVVEENFQARLPRYHSDDQSSEDRLLRDSEAAALADLIVSRSAQPPLAIGVFGDWGTGKSHFLCRILQFVRDKAQAVTDYDPIAHHRIRQVKFNAWHYAETDLWASLVAALFAALASPSDGEDIVDSQRRQSRLSAELAARRQLHERLKAVSERRADLERTLAGHRLWKSLRPAEQDAVRNGLGPLAGKAEQFYESMTYAATGALRWPANARRILWALWRVKWPLMAAGILAAVALTVGIVLSGFDTWARSLIVTIPAVPLVVTVLIGWKMLPSLDREDQSLFRRVQSYGERTHERLETSLATAKAEEAALRAELQNATPGGQLAGLIQERSTGDIYRARLGLMSQIHEDFALMAKLLQRAANDDEPLDEVGDRLPRVDRLVLYIDDLDRCPPTRVVEMLEAVHLLLALPLFVVVIAVDPRWLLHSLAHRYRGVLFTPDDAPVFEGDLRVSTPMQYLEKIFQLPFTLPAVNDVGHSTFVDWLTQPTQMPNAEESESRADSMASEIDTVAASSAFDGDIDWRAETGIGSLPPARTVSRSDPIALSEDERKWLAVLGPPLITTPRSIKRLVNSVCFLKAVSTPADWSAQRSESFSAAIVLLAILIGAPSQSPRFFTALYAERGDRTWQDFLHSLVPQLSTLGSEDDEGTTTRRLDLSEAEDWHHLVVSLQTQIGAGRNRGLSLPELVSDWKPWVIPVGRLSFETGHIVLNLESEAPLDDRKGYPQNPRNRHASKSASSRPGEQPLSESDMSAGDRYLSSLRSSAPTCSADLSCLYDTGLGKNVRSRWRRWTG